MRVLVTGATGFVGRRLVERLERPVVLSRNPDSARRQLGDVIAHAWNPEAGPPPAAAFEGVEAVIHLAGEPVAEGRWTAAKKRRIRESRVEGTRQLVAGLAELAQRPRVLVSASAVGIYGSQGETVLDETAAPAGDYLAEVCSAWEREALAATQLGLRVVNARIGIVLGPGGGALGKMLPIFKLGLGGRLASGQQWMPWIHLDDVVGLLLFAAEQEQATGPMNTVAPEPVSNREFTRVLAQTLRRPALFPAPAFGLRLGLGEFAQVLLASQRVVPRAAERWGYRFRYPDLAGALSASVGASSGAAATARSLA